MITNPHRQKVSKEFFDRSHAVMTKYYDLLERKLSSPKLKKEMERLVKADPLFFDPYLILADILFGDGKDTQARTLLNEAYHKAVKLIVDRNGTWPKEMAWSYLDNRHIMRTIERWAYILWEEGDKKEALDIFRHLLRVNPGDNQGIRHSILALRLGLGPDWEEAFVVKEGPLAGSGLDARKLDEWFDKHSKKFPDEFEWLFKEWRKRGY